MKSIFNAVHGSITLSEAPPLYDQLGKADFAETVAPYITKRYLRRVAKYIGVPVNQIRVCDALQWDRFFVHYKGLMLPLHDLKMDTMKAMSTVRAYQLSKDAIDAHLAEKDYVLYFGRIDKRLRLYMFSQLYNDIPDKDLLECFEYAQTSAEGRYDILSDGTLHNIYMRIRKSPEYRERMKELDGHANAEGFITIYRGCQGDRMIDEKERQRSWTLDKEIAEFFAKRFSEDNSQPGHVKQMDVHVSEVMLYLTGRGESEIMLKRGESK